MLIVPVFVSDPTLEKFRPLVIVKTPPFLRSGFIALKVDPRPFNVTMALFVVMEAVVSVKVELLPTIQAPPVSDPAR
jgi:hypothetical protein